MLELKQELWEKLHSSASGNGLLSMNLLKKIIAGDESEFDELLNQVCHQFTVGEVAYAVVPHLVKIAKNSSLSVQIRSLQIVGYVAASIGNNSFVDGCSREIPGYLKESYNKALQSALLIATSLIKKETLNKRDSLDILGVISALSGHPNLAMMAFMSGYDAVLECPECDEIIEYGSR